MKPERIIDAMLLIVAIAMVIAGHVVAKHQGAATMQPPDNTPNVRHAAVTGGRP